MAFDWRRGGLRLVLLPVSLLAVTLGSILWVTAGSVLRPAIYRPGTPGGTLPAFASDIAQSGATPPHSGLDGNPRSAFGLDFEPVAFFTDGGATLRGWRVPAPRPSRRAVVLVHDAWRDRRELLAHVPLLHALDFEVLLFDLREHGTSDGSARGPSFGPRESADVVSAARFLRAERRHERIVLFGRGLGGAACLLAAAAAPALADAVVTESAPARFFDLPAVPAFFVRVLVAVVDLRGEVSGVRVDPIDVVGRIATRPLLLIHGTSDSVVPSHHARLLHDAAGQPKTLWVVPGGKHEAPGDAAPDELRAQLTAFLAHGHE